MLGLFKKRVDQTCLIAAGQAVRRHLDEGMGIFCHTHETTLIEIDLAIRQVVEAQMFVVSLSTSLMNFALTDAYYDAGKASPFEGMPSFKFTQEDARTGLREAWSGFPTCRPNLDMRYRYISVQKLNTPAEEGLWQQIERKSEYYAQQHYEYKQPLSRDWLAFIWALRRKDVSEAQRLLSA